MSGIKKHNKPAFDKQEARLIKAGYEVFNPASLPVVPGWEWEDYMKRDLPHLMHCDSVTLLQGWRQSRGACLEYKTARTLAYEIYDEHMDIFNENILAEAERLVYGDRQTDYGHPKDDFTRTGRLWAAILGVTEVTPTQVGLCMVAVKISRHCNSPKRDNLVDGAGYFGCIARVEE